LEATLKGIKGVEKAGVSFKDKRAVVVLDETKTPLSALPMEVRRRHHTFRLTLFVPIAEKDREKAAKALQGVKGVKTVKAEKGGVLVTWDEKTAIRYGDLVAALQKEGVKVEEQDN